MTADLPAVVALDAMGVLYRDGNVVNRLLVPYLRGKGCQAPVATIRAAYHACSRGEIGTGELWARVGVSGSDEEYCESHTLNPGVHSALGRLREAGLSLACLTNDTSRWSALLRQRFGLDRYIDRWYVSAEIGIRKPEAGAYQALLSGLDLPAPDVLFVDDRGPNLLPARAAGMRTLLFSSDDTDQHAVPRDQLRVHTMADLTAAILSPH